MIWIPVGLDTQSSTEELVVEEPESSPATTETVNIDDAIPTEALMSEEWTYDEGEGVQEPEAPEPNPIHDAIRTNIVALINEYGRYPVSICSPRTSRVFGNRRLLYSPR